MSIYINAHYPLKNGGRKAIAGPITEGPLANIQSFDEDIEMDQDEWPELTDFLYDYNKSGAILQKDMKYYIDLENIISYAVCVTPDNVYAVEVYAGGDWQTPGIFYLYQSPKGVRLYVPLKGNTINPKTKAAFGEDEDEDAEYLLKEYKAGRILNYEGKPINTDPDFLDTVGDPNDNDSIVEALWDLRPDTELCFQEFCSRVEAE